MTIKPARLKNLETESTYFFVGGPFSQWYPSKFSDENGQEFVTAEQYMMYNKATLFDDVDTAQKILNSPNPKDQRSLGRQVQNFDPEIWDKNSLSIVTQGNRFKFSQNPDLAEILKSKGSKRIVEAADYDPVWGIKLGAYDRRIFDETLWQGTNFLGQAITTVRKEMFGPNIQSTFAVKANSNIEIDNTLLASQHRDWLYCDQAINLSDDSSGEFYQTTIKAIADHNGLSFKDALKLLVSTPSASSAEIECPSFDKEMRIEKISVLEGLNINFFQRAKMIINQFEAFDEDFEVSRDFTQAEKLEI